MTKNQSQDRQDDQNQTDEQSELEKQRLANLKASGQLQEDQDPEQAMQAQQQEEGESK